MKAVRPQNACSVSNHQHMSCNGYSKMNIVTFVASGFIAGTNKAHAVNTVKMAEGFAALGHSVLMTCRAPEDGEPTPEYLQNLYGLRHPVQWRLIRATPQGSLWEFAEKIISSLKSPLPDFAYCRDFLIPCLTSENGILSVAESHAHPDNVSAPLMQCIEHLSHEKFALLATISPVLRDAFIAKGAPAEKVHVFSTGVAVELFTPPPVLPPSPFQDAYNVVYSGHLYEYKGIAAILDAAMRLPAISFHLVGGMEADIQRVTSLAKTRRLANVKLHGHVPQASLPPYLWHADVLLLTHARDHPQALWTSPNKLGDYLASGRPVIVSDVPALRALLSDEEAFFVPPDSSDALAEKIEQIISRRDGVARIAAAGQALARTRSYPERARKIFDRAMKGKS